MAILLHIIPNLSAKHELEKYRTVPIVNACCFSFKPGG